MSAFFPRSSKFLPTLCLVVATLSAYKGGGVWRLLTLARMRVLLLCVLRLACAVQLLWAGRPPAGVRDMARRIFRHGAPAGLTISVAAPDWCVGGACRFEWRPQADAASVRHLLLFSQGEVGALRVGGKATRVSAAPSLPAFLPAEVSVRWRLHALPARAAAAAVTLRLRPPAQPAHLGLIWAYASRHDAPTARHKRSVDAAIDLDSDEAFRLASAAEQETEAEQWQGRRLPGFGCRLESVTVDLDALGWSRWIVAPMRYRVNACVGSCHFLGLSGRRGVSSHALMQAAVNAVNHEVLPPPCCVPTRYEPLPVLVENDDRLIHYMAVPDMSAAACACV